MSKLFKFKRFEVAHENCGMKIGVDGVILGAWATQDNPQNILDIGTGSGVIALMLAQRYEKATVHAVELEVNAFQQACENFNTSPFKDRMIAYHTNIIDFTSETLFDLIVCNPPFYQDQRDLESPERSMARQAKYLPLNLIFEKAKKLLHPHGKMNLILPSEQLEQAQNYALTFQFHLTRICYIKGQKTTKTKRILLEFCIQENKTPTITETLVIEKERGVYTDEYQSLTNDFYLKF